MIEQKIIIDIDHLKKHDLNTLAHVLSKAASWSSLSIAAARTVVQMSQQFAQLGRDADVTQAGVGDGGAARTVRGREGPPPPLRLSPRRSEGPGVTAGQQASRSREPFVDLWCSSPYTHTDTGGGPSRPREAFEPPPSPCPAENVTPAVTSVTPGVTDSVTRVTPGRLV